MIKSDEDGVFCGDDHLRGGGRCSAVQGELSQAGGDVSVQVASVVGRHVGVHVRQQKVTRARDVLGESDGQARPTPLLERESRRVLRQKPAQTRNMYSKHIHSDL